MTASTIPTDQARRPSADNLSDSLETVSTIVLVAFLSSLTVIVLL